MGKTKIKTIEAEELVTANAVETNNEVSKENLKDINAKSVKSEKKSKAAQKKGTVKIRGKKHQEAVKQVNPTKNYPVKEAIELAQKVSYTSFPATIETHINIKIKNIRGLVNMPFQSGKQLRVLAFGKGAEESGADIAGSENTIEEIETGKLHFDTIVTTPEWMPKLAKVAKILGPRGLMPNPKNGTVTDNLSKAVEELKGGKTEYKTENQGQVIHLAIGRTDQKQEEIAANLKALYNAIGRSKVKKIILAPSMGPGVKVDISSI